MVLADNEADFLDSQDAILFNDNPYSLSSEAEDVVEIYSSLPERIRPPGEAGICF